MGSGGDDVTLLDYSRIVWRYKMLLGAIGFIAIAGTIGLTKLSPKIYEASTTVMSPREGGGAGLLPGGFAGLTQQLSGIPLPSLTPNRDMLISLLKSRTMAQALVRRFGLQEHYQARFLDEAITRLQGATGLFVSKEGVISIKVQDTDPQRVAQMANFYVEHLERLVSEYSTSEAGRQRRFITEQLARSKKELTESEEELRRFQERNRAMVLQEQTRGAIDAAARLKGEIIAADVQLQVLRNFATEANPDVVATRRRLEEMRRQLSQMQYGETVSPTAGGRNGDYAVPFARVPEVGLQLARRTRDVKVGETVVTLLTQQLEQAKITEAKDIPVVQVLDVATVPERHSKPRLRDNLLIAVVVSVFVGLVLVFSIEYLGRLRMRSGAAA